MVAFTSLPAEARPKFSDRYGTILRREYKRTLRRMGQFAFCPAQDTGPKSLTVLKLRGVLGTFAALISLASLLLLTELAAGRYLVLIGRMTLR